MKFQLETFLYFYDPGRESGQGFVVSDPEETESESLEALKISIQLADHFSDQTFPIPVNGNIRSFPSKDVCEVKIVIKEII